MSTLEELLDEMYSDERFMNKKSIQPKVYSDEPIIKRASAMKNYAPPKIAEMRALAEGHGVNWTSPRLFVRQGRLMADYEDDCPYRGGFFRYYPTYQLMSDEQLRGYFTWRAGVRRGRVEYIPLSFVFVYIYELLNLIGVGSPQEGYEKLVWFRDAYAPFDGSVEHYLKDWLVDFVAYYGLDPTLIRDEESLSPYRHYTVLSRWKTHTQEALFAAVCGLSSYNIEKSKFYKAFPEDTKAVLCRVFADFSQHHADRCKNSLCERLFGKVHTLPYTMFASAVVPFDREKPDCEYEIFPCYGYACRNGVWYRTRLDRSPAKNRKLGELVRDVDAILRERCGFDAPLKRTDATKVFTGIVNNAFDEWQAEKKRRAAAVIRIDVSKLDAIRSDASETREKLMTQEERDDEGGNAARRLAPLESGNTESEVGSRKPKVSQAGSESGLMEIEGQGSLFDPGFAPSEETASPLEGPKREAAAAPDAPNQGGLPLDETERRVLRAVLDGGDCAAAAGSGGRMLSVVIDSVNDKLYDLFGDAVIFDGSDGPAVYEEYEEEIKERIGT